MRHLLTMTAIILSICGGVLAEDNTLTPQEEQDGWQLLFDGKTLNGWITSDRKPSQRPVENGTLNPRHSGHYMLMYERPWGDFILSLEFKISPRCNSGVFFRTCPLTPLPGKDVGYNGLEVAIDDTASAGYVDTGAIYDLSPPTENAMKPVGEWNQLRLTCQGPVIDVEMNGKPVNHVDLGQFTEFGKRPDGTTHKFEKIFAEHPSAGYIGLQDHGGECWYKNIKLKPLGNADTKCED